MQLAGKFSDAGKFSLRMLMGSRFHEEVLVLGLTFEEGNEVRK